MNVAACQPFWSSAGERRLCASFHPAARPVAAARGILLVPPLLHELPRCTRSLFEMANVLSALGLPCLRFAYFGTGDSEGTSDEADFATMAADIGQAAAELRARGRCSRWVLLACRSGALPAHGWLARTDTPPSLVILWDPVLDGATWREGLEQAGAGDRGQAGEGGADLAAARGDAPLMGYGVPATFRMELDAARWNGVALRHPIPVWRVAADESEPLPGLQRSFRLPPGTAAFGTDFTMAVDDMPSPRWKQLVRDVGDAVLSGR